MRLSNHFLSLYIYVLGLVSNFFLYVQRFFGASCRLVNYRDSAHFSEHKTPLDLSFNVNRTLFPILFILSVLVCSGSALQDKNIQFGDFGGSCGMWRDGSYVVGLYTQENRHNHYIRVHNNEGKLQYGIQLPEDVHTLLTLNSGNLGILKENNRKKLTMEIIDKNGTTVKTEFEIYGKEYNGFSATSSERYGGGFAIMWAIDNHRALMTARFTDDGELIDSSVKKFDNAILDFTIASAIDGKRDVQLGAHTFVVHQATFDDSSPHYFPTIGCKAKRNGYGNVCIYNYLRKYSSKIQRITVFQEFYSNGLLPKSAITAKKLINFPRNIDPEKYLEQLVIPIIHPFPYGGWAIQYNGFYKHKLLYYSERNSDNANSTEIQLPSRISCVSPNNTLLAVKFGPHNKGWELRSQPIQPLAAEERLEFEYYNPYIISATKEVDISSHDTILDISFNIPDLRPGLGLLAIYSANNNMFPREILAADDFDVSFSNNTIHIKLLASTLNFYDSEYYAILENGFANSFYGEPLQGIQEPPALWKIKTKPRLQKPTPSDMERILVEVQLKDTKNKRATVDLSEETSLLLEEVAKYLPIDISRLEKAFNWHDEASNKTTIQFFIKDGDEKSKYPTE
ncbi:hypothetical protein K7432_004628 [Basidiobolus ranarum]|uniref:Uncharacterized protein n=1 Tax=Basidiobolus ranarum TaxID=34480 RepID=A0ABR2WXX6_9FUNG